MGRGLPGINVSPTRQRLHVRQQPHTLLLLLPDPISPFRSSSYIQSQRFDLPSSSSLLVLDWYTSGRKLGKGEEWDFSRYESLNQVVVDGKTLMREKLVLDNDEDVTTGVPSLAKRMSPYHVYATLLIYGESMVPLLQMFAQHALETVQHQVSTPADMVWSFSYIRSGGKGETGRAGVVKAAAKDVEGLRIWLREMLELGGVEEMIGQAMWSRVF
jgi:urease accessory protein